MRIGSVEIGIDEDIEVKGKDEIWVWKRNGEIHIIRSNAILFEALVREWKEENKRDELFESGAGI